MLLSGAIFLLPTSSNRQVPPFAPIAVFLFGPLIQERLDIGTAMPIDNAHRLVQEEVGTLGAAFRRDAIYAGAISKLSRYEAAIERSLYRALHELQRVQAARKDGKSPPSIAVDITVDGPGAASDSED